MSTNPAASTAIPIVTATRLVRKLRGGAQAHLLKADDGHYYAVKFRENPQHRRILINELLSAEILSYLKVAIPSYRLIDVPKAFLDEHRDVFIAIRNSRVDISPGLHFGSRFPINPETGKMYEFLPDESMERVANVRDFLGALVFDLWVSNGDGRQSVFFDQSKTSNGPEKTNSGASFATLMIDNGYAFNGEHWRFTENPITGVYPKTCVYDGVTSIASFEPWLSAATNCPETIIQDAVSKIPAEWLAPEDDLIRLAACLDRRKERLATMIEDCQAGPRQPFRHWKT